MSGSKYADLPDIDTAPDVYETEDVIPQSQTSDGGSSDDEHGIPTRSAKPPRDTSTREELDYSNLMNTEQATRKFRKAEADQRKARTKTLYEYPSDSYSTGDDPNTPRSVPLSYRLRSLQSELLALEQELADPTNPLLQKDNEAENLDAGELIRGLVDVRSRLDKIKKGKEGRARLVEQVLDTDALHNHEAPARSSEKATPGLAADTKVPPRSEIETMVDIDRRVRDLESLVGSSGTALDEASTLPPPLLPSITRLSNQLTILTQPRHIDSISRRLKLLLSDLERSSTFQNQGHRRNGSQSNGAGSNPALQEQLLPLLQRLGPLLPHIPHILTRLRTLAALHSSATDFQSTLEDLEEDQKKTRNDLMDLDKAVRTVEDSLNKNREVVKTNISGLEARVNSLTTRLEDLQIQTT